jgi:hypothetical protein
VTAVQGEGSFDGEYCCYAVTEQSMDDSPCSLGGGGNNFGGFAGSAGSGLGAVGGSGCDSEGDPCPGGLPCCPGLVCNGMSFQCLPPGTGGAGGVGGGGAGTGGTGGNAGCATCAGELVALGSTASTLCAGSAPFWDALTSCACGSGACASDCTATFCDGVSPDSMCAMCLVDTTSGCGGASTACKSN